MTHEIASLPDVQEQAAVLVAENRLTDAQIAESLSVSRASITRWKRRPEFQARVMVLQQSINDAALQIAIANRENRVLALNDRWERMRQIIDERGNDPAVQDAAGGKTGLIVRQMKMIGSGEAAIPVTEYMVDIPLLREIRATEQQAAQELGQWTEKTESTHDQNIVFTIQFDRAGEDS